MIKYLLVFTIAMKAVVSQINFPNCNTTYTSCVQDTTCNEIFGTPAYTACTGSNGCQTFGLNYNNIVSEFFCEDTCLNQVDAEGNDNFLNFQSCVGGLITQDLCSSQLNTCQMNTGTNNCEQLINTQSIAGCFNTNQACSFAEANNTVLYGCYTACLANINSTNSIWNSFSGCVSTLGSTCYTNLQNCIANQQGCGSVIPAVNTCVLSACPTLFNTIAATATEISSCTVPCLNQNAPQNPSAEWTALVNCYNSTDPSPTPTPDPSPSPSSDNSTSSGNTTSSEVPPSNSSTPIPPSNSSVNPTPSNSTGSTTSSANHLVTVFSCATAIIVAALTL